MKNELNIRCSMSRDSLLVTGSEQAIYALVDIKASGGSRTGTLPANLALVLDRSGSMDGDKMIRLKEAVNAIVDRLGDQDRLSVTVFDDTVETIVPGQLVRDRDSIKTAVAKVIPRGGTQISDGLRAGLEEVRQGLAPDRVNRIILLTDGRTWDDEPACRSLADDAGKDGIAITSIGIGDDWNEKLLLQIAECSRGNSHWIEDPAAMSEAFQEEVDGAQSVAATNLKVAMRSSPGVRPVRIYATVPMLADLSSKAVQGGALAADLGSLDGNKGQTLLLEIRLPARNEGPFRLGQLEVAYDIPSQGIAGRRITQDLNVAFTTDIAAAAKVNAAVMNLAEKISAFKLQTRALADIQAGDLEAATRRLQSAATVLLDLGEDELAAAAEQEVRSLTRTGVLTPGGTKKLEYGTRKLTQVLK